MCIPLEPFTFDVFFSISLGPSDGNSTKQFSIDYGNRGIKKFGDKCDSTHECGFPGSICDSKKRSCQCIEELPVTNHIDKCGKGTYFVVFRFFSQRFFTCHPVQSCQCIPQKLVISFIREFFLARYGVEWVVICTYYRMLDNFRESVT